MERLFRTSSLIPMKIFIRMLITLLRSMRLLSGITGGGAYLNLATGIPLRLSINVEMRSKDILRILIIPRMMVRIKMDRFKIHLGIEKRGSAETRSQSRILYRERQHKPESRSL